MSDRQIAAGLAVLTADAVAVLVVVLLALTHALPSLNDVARMILVPFSG